MTPSPQQCRDELERILASPDFARADQLRILLQWLCLRRLDTPSASFTQYDIGTGCLGRKKDFDPHYDSVVRKETARLRRHLEAHYASLPSPPACRIVIQPGTYLPQWIVTAPNSPDNGNPGACRVLVLPFDLVPSATEPGLAEAFSIALMAELAAEPGIEVGPRYLALLQRQRPSPHPFHYLLEGILEHRQDAIHAHAWLVRGERAFLHPVRASAPTVGELAALVRASYATVLKPRAASA
ncbi:MAG: hypothetical protein JNK87_40875 [Bryobacterales bacterium]|nr:hypothetical protein [Bryobacterales bacterium]